MNRRRSLRVLASGATVGLAGCLSSLFSEADPPLERAERRVDGQWPMQGYDAGNTRRATASGVLDAEHAWTASVGRNHRAEPLVADSLVFDAAPGGSTVATVEAATGERNTTVPVDGADGVPIAVDDGRLYVLVGGNELRALDRETVATRWSVELEGPPLWSFGRTTAYALDPFDPGLLAFDRADGDRRWTFDLVDSPGQLAETEDLTLVSVGSRVYAIDDGEYAWNRRFESDVHALAAGPDACFASTEDGTLAKLEPGGDQVWTASVGRLPGGLGLGEDVLYTCDDEQLFGFDRASGERAVGEIVPEYVTAVTVGSDAVYGLGKGGLVALDGTDGTRVWDAGERESPGHSGPVVLDGTVLVRTAQSEDSATLHALVES